MFLVTGCAGFIGSHVTKALLDAGEEVIGIDNFDPYYSEKIKKHRLESLTSYEDFYFINGDIRDNKLIDDVFSKYKIEGIFNLAAKAGVRASINNPKEYFDVNVNGFINLLEKAKEDDIKIVHSSTSSVYGNNKPPFKEDMKCDTMLSPYASSKKASENIGYVYYYLYGVNVIILRYFTVYGPAGRPDMSIFKFMKNILLGKPIEIYGDGTQRRSFTYVDDIVRGTIKAFDLKGFEIINLGNDKKHDLNYVVSLIEKVSGKKAMIRYRDWMKADIYETHADITKARSLLDWEPKTTLEEGIEKTYEWFHNNREVWNS